MVDSSLQSNVTFTIFSKSILGGKLLLVLNCAFKKQTKSQLKKIVSETVNFGSLNFTKPKKKPRNTIKYHNIFTISFISNCGRSRSDFFFFFYVHNNFTKNLKWQIATSFKLKPPL